MKTLSLHQHDIVRGIKGAGKGVILIWLFALMGCGPDWVWPDRTRIPIDNLWVSTKFGTPVPTQAAPYYFNVNGTEQSGNGYYYNVSDNFQGYIPNGCTRIFEIVNNQLTAVITCKAPRYGNKNPNNLIWKDPLTFTISIKADVITNTVTSAVLTVPDYNQVIDFTDKVTISSVNGMMVVGGENYKLTTNDGRQLNLYVTFSYVN